MTFLAPSRDGQKYTPWRQAQMLLLESGDGSKVIEPPLQLSSCIERGSGEWDVKIHQHRHLVALSSKKIFLLQPCDVQLGWVWVRGQRTKIESKEELEGERWKVKWKKSKASLEWLRLSKQNENSWLYHDCNFDGCEIESSSKMLKVSACSKQRKTQVEAEQIIEKISTLTKISFRNLYIDFTIDALLRMIEKIISIIF